MAALHPETDLQSGYKFDSSEFMKTAQALSERTQSAQRFREYQLGEKKKFDDTGQSAIPEFIYTIHAATRGMKEQDRAGYMQQLRDRMAQRLERYEWRKSRGAELSPEQQQVYDSLLSKIQDLNQMMEAPEEMTKYMEGVGAFITPKMGVKQDFDLSQIIPNTKTPNPMVPIGGARGVNF